MIPLKLDDVPRLAWPATCQKMLDDFAPPIRVIVAPLAIVRFCAISKIKTSVGLPEIVKPPADTRTAVLHL